MTPQEKSFFDSLPRSITDYIKDFTFGANVKWDLVNSNLKRLYDPIYTNWDKAIQRYKSVENLKHTLNDIPTINKDIIKRWLEEEKAFEANKQELLSLLEESHTTPNADNTISIAKKLGLFPNENGLFSFLIDKDQIPYSERENLTEKIKLKTNILSNISNNLAELFLCGNTITYPYGTVITQTKTKYLYRGENAFYGKSLPSAFRNLDTKLPPKICELIYKIKLNESMLFLDNFDAVTQWRKSEVNYLALAQHYGCPTPMLDITSDLKTALFFACCKYENRKWRPLNQKDFSFQKTSANFNANYGIIFRTDSEINDLNCFCNGKKLINKLFPVGFQPFARCSAQYAYTLYAPQPTYSLFLDPIFEKYKFTHDEDFCNWIFNEMHHGDAVYPQNDIPDLSPYFKKINNSHHFSTEAFNLSVENRYSESEKENLKKTLAKYGYTILKGKQEYISYKDLNKINKKYTIEKAYQILPTTTYANPALIMWADH